MAFLLLLYMEVKQFRGNALESFNQQQLLFRYLYYSALIAVTLALGTSYTGVQQAFIYFQF